MHRFSPIVVGDIGATNIRMATAVFDGQWNLAARYRAYTPREGNARTVLAAIYAAIHNVADETKQYPNLISLGCPGIIAPDRGQIKWSSKIPGLNGMHLAREIEQMFEVTTFVDNDAQVAAQGEQRFGVGHRYRSLVYLSVGTGIGCSLMIDGQTVRGWDNMAAGVGHTCVSDRDDAPICDGCKQRGCLTRIASGHGMNLTARERLRAGESSIVGRADFCNGRISGSIIATAARQGDTMAQSIMDQANRALAQAIKNLIITVGPEAIIISGGRTNIGEQFFTPLRAEVARTLPSTYARIPILRSELGEDIGLWGALAQVEQHIPQLEVPVRRAYEQSPLLTTALALG